MPLVPKDIFYNWKLQVGLYILEDNQTVNWLTSLFLAAMRKLILDHIVAMTATSVLPYEPT
jgi:hypothetical protein